MLLVKEKKFELIDSCCIFCGKYIGHYGKGIENVMNDSFLIGHFTKDGEIIIRTGACNDYHWVCKECAEKIIKALDLKVNNKEG